MRPARSVRLAIILTFVVLTVGAVLCVGGCSKPKTAPEPEPAVKPPAIAEAGILRVGLDLAYPPFGGEDKSKQAGIDVDIAEALAASLDLELEIVSTPASEAASALTSGTIDVAMSVPITASNVASAAIVGSYIADGPAFFTTAEETVTIEAIGDRAIGAQRGSGAFWALEQALGEGTVQAFPTLRDALGALADGKMAIVAGDAIVGAYIARDFPEVRFAGQLGAASSLVLAVAKENSELAKVLTDSLDKLASDGVLRAVRRKWVGELPELAVPAQ